VPLVVSAYLVGGFISQWPVGIWSDRVDRRVVIFSVSVLAFVSSLFITFGAHLGKLDLVSLLILVGFFGSGSIPVYPISVAHANDWMKKTSVVDLSVLLLVSSSFGSVLGPMIVGGVLPWVGVQNLFLLISCTHGMLLLVSLYRIVRYAPIPKSKKTGYLDLPETTPMISTVAGAGD
jgi:MFS family permease